MTKKEEFALWVAMLKDSVITWDGTKDRAGNQKKQILKVMPLWKLERKPKKKKTIK